MIPKPKKVKAKITRLVTEIAIVRLAREGFVEEIEEVCEELEDDDVEILSIISVITTYP